jgi:uncharacterized membrane protein required for colicin V production
MSLDKLPINAFDLVLAAILAFGLVRGRRIGMSGELLSVIKWLAVLFGCAMAYEPLGQLLADTTGIFSLLWCYLIAYVGVGAIILVVFALFKHGLGGKLLGSDLFGRAEYYLGMGSGLVRFACMLVAALALLNARYFSVAEVKAMEKFQTDVYGSNFFPGLHSMQDTVFEKSLTGPWIKQNLGFLLIKPTQPEDKQIRRQEARLQ